MAGYHQALVCLNGHLINEDADVNPAKNCKACPKCGADTLSECSACGKSIRGAYWESNGYFIESDCCRLANFCHACGKPYPWTERKQEALKELLNEVIEQEAERLKLVESIPDIITETPRSDLAVFRFQRALSKLSGYAHKTLRDMIVSTAASVVANKITG